MKESGILAGSSDLFFYGVAEISQQIKKTSIDRFPKLYTHTPPKG